MFGGFFFAELKIYVIIIVIIFLDFQENVGGLYLDQPLSNYPDLFTEVPNFCCAVEIFLFAILALEM